jgi:Outer membrane protein beta-barrel domain
MKGLRIAFAAAGLVSIFAASPARADESPTAGHASVAGLLGYGFKDGVGVGLGVRGGYTLPMNLYLGGTFMYHFGKSENDGFGDVSEHLYYFGVEGGYDIYAAPVIIRPYLGLGAATATASVPSSTFDGVTIGGGSVSDTKFGVWPGVSALYPIGSAFVGADARFLIVSDFNAFSLFATGGYQF